MKPTISSESQHVLKQIDELQRLKTAQLREKWTTLMGSEPGQLGRTYLIRRLAYRIQELAYGGLTRTARERLAATPRPSERKRRTNKLQPGTRLLRDWRGQRYEVIVQEKGFLFDGKYYRSLSAIARAITGSYWSGNRFFGLAPSRHNQRESA